MKLLQAALGAGFSLAVFATGTFAQSDNAAGANVPGSALPPKFLFINPSDLQDPTCVHGLCTLEIHKYDNTCVYGFCASKNQKVTIPEAGLKAMQDSVK
jgi:hypothetical protein